MTIAICWISTRRCSRRWVTAPSSASRSSPIRRSRPELLIIDLRWRRDGLAGWDVLLAVRRDPELGELPIILCTGDLEGLKEHAEAIAQDPLVETLPKPFQVADLETLVRRLVGAATPSA